MVGQDQRSHDAGAFRRAERRFFQGAGREEQALRRRPVRRFAARASRQGSRHQRTRLAQSVHPHAARASRPGRVERLCP